LNKNSWFPDFAEPVFKNSSLLLFTELVSVMSIRFLKLYWHTKIVLKLVAGSLALKIFFIGWL